VAPSLGDARSGIDLDALSSPDRDTLTPRAAVPAAALAELLETARGALVRGDAHAVLAALDRGWAGAAQSESGWYFRGAALALLGLPGEAVRVLLEADAHRPASAALRFLESIVHDAAHDVPAARAALARARALAPAAPILHLWDTVLLARRGERTSAMARLQVLSATLGEEPLVRWARAAIVRAGADAVRADGVRADGVRADAVHADAVRADAVRADAVRADAVRADAVRADAVRGVAIAPLPSDPDSFVRDPSSSRARAGDDHPLGVVRRPESATPRWLLDEPRLQGLDAAVQALGGRLAHRDGDELAGEVRALLQAMSGHGHLRDAARPEQRLAVRRVLTMLLTALTASPADPGMARGVGTERVARHDAAARLTPIDGGPSIDIAPSEHGERVVLTVLGALLRGEADDAERRLTRAGATLPAAMHTMLQQLACAARADDGTLPTVAHLVIAPVAGQPVDGLLTPLRFGLALLAYASPRLEAAALAAPGAVTGVAGASAAPPASISFVPVPRVWRRLRWPLAAAAVLALALGHPFTALLCAAGACWLLLR
jgi:hypothetical protein